MLCDYKETVWIALETDKDSVKQSIRFGLFDIPSTSNHCVQ